MSSKKKGSKLNAAANSTTDIKGLNFCSVKEYGQFNSNEYKIFVAPNRPLQSRLVNLNSLRPHGAVGSAELRSRFHSHPVPENVVKDILTLVNDAQSRVHRCPDFTLVTSVREAMESLHSTAYEQWWMDHIAKGCLSTNAYPFSSLRFAAPHENSQGCSMNSNSSVPDSLSGIAEAIQRILFVCTQSSNNGDQATEKLLFHSIRNEKASLKELVLTSYNSNHILVCCGLYFYRLNVLDENGVAINVGDITLLLRAVREHAEATEKALREQLLLPDVMNDLVQFHHMLGYMSEIANPECAALMDRLRRANSVNAAALDIMDSSIFTVVLRNPCEAGSPRARWYRTGMLLEEDDDGRLLTLRAHTIITDHTSLVDFLTQVINWRDEHERLGRSSCLLGKTKDEYFVSTPNEPAMIEHLNLWLPWKHRKPMWPYPQKNAMPSVFPLEFTTLGEGVVTFSCLCLAAVLAVQEVLTPSHGFPTVLVAFPHKRGGVSSALLYSKVVEAFIQSLRSESALVEAVTVRHMARAALQALNTIINACFSEQYPLYTMAQLLLSEGKAEAKDATHDGGMLGAVDLVLSIDPLSCGGDILHSETQLVMPTPFAIRSVGRCTPGAARQQTNVKLPSALEVTDAALLQMPGAGESSTGRRLSACILERSQVLLTLLK